MDLSFGSRLRRAWSVFRNRDPMTDMSWQLGYGDSRRADRVVLSSNNEKTIVNAIYNRIALDVASLKFRHVRLDENERFKEEIDGGLNEIFKTEANLDQSGRAFIHDVALSMIDEGVVAACPVGWGCAAGSLVASFPSLLQAGDQQTGLACCGCMVAEPWKTLL